MFRERLQPNDPLLCRIIGLAAGLVVLHGFLFLLWGRGPVVEALSWVAPLADAVAALAGASVAFLALGRYRVLHEPVPFWIGIAFGASAVLDVFYLLSWPGLLGDDRGLIAELPNTSAWLFGLKFSLLALFLLVAVLVRSPRAGAREEQWLRLAAAAMAAAALIGWLSVAFEHFLPSLVVDAAWTPAYIACLSALMGAFVVGGVLSTLRYRKGGDTFLGYVALTQVTLVFFFLSSVIGTERYDTWWYWRRVLLICGFTVILFGLLSEYVALYRQERERTRELEELQRVTEPALARKGLELLLQNLLERVVSVMGADAGAILLLDLTRQELLFRKGVGIPEEQAVGLRVKIGEGFAGQVAARNAVFWVRDAQTSPALWGPYIQERHVGGILGAPMRVGEDVIGIVQVDFLAPRGFTPHEERLLEVVALRAALAIQQQTLLEKAEQERQRLQVLVDTTPAGITFHRAPDGRLELYNKTAEVILGRPMAPEVGIAGIIEYYEVRRSTGQPFPTEELPANRSLNGEVCVGVEMLIRRPDGREVYILTNSAPLRDARGQIVGAAVAFQDITPIKEQERLREEFIAAAAHELKTPVTTIKGYAQLMRVWAPGGHEPREGKAFDVINAQVDRLTRRVQEMLEVTRFRVDPPELHMARFDLGELGSRVVQGVQATVGHLRLVLELDGPVVVKADRERIEQVLISLLDNAIRYSPGGGQILVQVWASGGEAMVSIKDEGVGISTERLAHVFEPFYEAVPPGAMGYLGTVVLSLYLSKLIVERHNGRIWLVSEEGKGSTFSFTLPLSRSGDGVQA